MINALCHESGVEDNLVEGCEQLVGLVTFLLFGALVARLDGKFLEGQCLVLSVEELL